MDRIAIEPGQPSVPYVRDTSITVWTVYKALVFDGIPEVEVLQMFPELEPEDLPAVRESVAHSIKTRTHDEFTGRSILARDRLIHGRYYEGRCRNATIARWHRDEECFYHWRQTHERIYVQTIKYPTDEQEPWLDVFDVVEELPCPKFEIPFDVEAVFAGHRDYLSQYAEEMWSRHSSNKTARR